MISKEMNCKRKETAWKSAVKNSTRTDRISNNSNMRLSRSSKVCNNSEKVFNRSNKV